MKCVYSDDSKVEVNYNPRLKWSTILSHPDVDLKLAERSDSHNKIVYVRGVNDRGLCALDSPDLGFADLKTQLKASSRAKYSVFVTYNSIVNETGKILEDVCFKDMILLKTAGGIKQFIGELDKHNIYDAFISRRCAIAKMLYDDRVIDVIIPALDKESKNLISKQVREGSILRFSGMIVPMFYTDVTKYPIFVNEYVVEKEDFSDVALTLPNIRSVKDLAFFLNTSTGSSLYTDETNVILFFTVAYVKEGDPVFNLILSGAAGAGKTSAAVLLSKIFSTNGSFIGGNMSTAKGLVPSYGDKPHPGLLIAPRNFVKVVDEVFRRAEKEANARSIVDPTAYIYSFLMDLMNVVERRPDVLAGSGKGQLPPGTYMRDSFLATDNMKHNVRIAITSCVINDKAVMRRFTFLSVTEDDALRVKNCDGRPSVDQLLDWLEGNLRCRGLSLYKMKRFAEWFRTVVCDINVNSKWCKNITEEIERELLRSILEGDSISVDADKIIETWIMELNIIPFYEAFVRCCCVLRTVFDQKLPELPEKFTIDIVDYVFAEQLFRRLFTDTFNMYRDGIKRLRDAESRGIPRVLGGLNDGQRT